MSTMNQPVRAADESNMRKPSKFGVLAQPWAVGAAGAGLLVLGAGAFFLQRSHQDGRPSHPLSSSYHSRGGHQVFEPIKRADTLETEDPHSEESTRSLEDVLSNLENAESAGAAHPRKSLAAKPRTEKKSKPKTAKKEPEKPKELTAEEKEAEKQKAKDMIREHIAKLEAEGGKKDAKTRKAVAKLKKLLEGDDKEQEAPAEPEKAEEDNQAHLDFAKALKAEQEREIHIKLTDVRAEFKKDFGDDAKALLCSGCRMVAARITSEMDTHDVHDQETPFQMLQAKRKAIDSTCSSLRHLQVVKPDDGPARFEASEVVGEGEQEGKRLCSAILEESRFDMIAKMIQSKVPMAHMMGGSRQVHKNWERYICAERTKLCKKSETREDDEEPEQDL